MAEAVGLVASIVGITSFAVTVLELLADELSDNEPIYSQKALDFAALLRNDSEDFFQNIERLLPVRRGERNDISVLNKITWSFKKSKVDLIIVELERLKATVQLFVGVLALGHEYKAYRRQKSSPKRVEATKTAFTNVQNMLVEHVDTTELAAMERDKAQQEVEDDEQWATLGNDHHHAQSSTALVRVTPSSLILLRDSSGISFEAYEGDLAQNLRNSPNYALRLLREWTVVPAADDNDEQDPLVTRRGIPRLLNDKTQDRSRRARQEYRSQDTKFTQAPIAREYFDVSSRDTQQRSEAFERLRRKEPTLVTPEPDVYAPDVILLDIENRGVAVLSYPVCSIAQRLVRAYDLQKYTAEQLGEDDYRNV